MKWLPCFEVCNSKLWSTKYTRWILISPCYLFWYRSFCVLLIIELRILYLRRHEASQPSCIAKSIDLLVTQWLIGQERIMWGPYWPNIIINIETWPYPRIGSFPGDRLFHYLGYLWINRPSIPLMATYPNGKCILCHVTPFFSWFWGQNHWVGRSVTYLYYCYYLNVYYYLKVSHRPRNVIRYHLPSCFNVYWPLGATSLKGDYWPIVLLNLVALWQLSWLYWRITIGPFGLLGVGKECNSKPHLLDPWGPLGFYWTLVDLWGYSIGPLACYEATIGGPFGSKAPWGSSIALALYRRGLVVKRGCSYGQ